MRAIMLAAGVGARLGAGEASPPKVLLEFGGKSLLRRHLDILRAAGVSDLVLVLGYRAELIEREIAACGARDFVTTTLNPDFRNGSIVSLWVARDTLRRGGDILLMDGDVLYDRRILERLIGTRHANCFLMDRDFEPGDEPVKLCIRDGRIVDFEKKVEHAHDYAGESVGFFRFGETVCRALADAVESGVAAGRAKDMYERAIRDVLLAGPAERFGFEDVTGLPWIEIDFPEDVERARREVLPRIDGTEQ
jgi:choline kinase